MSKGCVGAENPFRSLESSLDEGSWNRFSRLCQEQGGFVVELCRSGSIAEDCDCSEVLAK